MDKLYDLMVMCLKYQLTHLRTAVEIHSITLNHLDSLERMLDDPQAFFQNEKDKMEKFKNTKSDSNDNANSGISMIRNAKTMFIKHYSKIANTDYETIRMNLLKFSGEQHTRISMFLRNNVQDDRGRFVVNPELVKNRVPFQFVNSEVLDVCYRGSDLGLSLYHSFGRKVNDAEKSGEKSGDKTTNSPENRKKGSENRKSVTELDEDVALGEICILTSFIGQNQDGDEEDDFSPDIFNDEELDMF